MRDLFKGYRIFNIDPKKSRSKDFYKNVLADRERVMKKFAHTIQKPSAFVCLLCGSKKKKSFLAYGKYELFECLRCGLVSPNISTSAINRALYDDTRNAERIIKEILASYRYRKETHAPERLNYLIEKTGLSTKNIRLLDVGCGPGYFLSYLKDKKIRSKGLEITDFLIKICRKQGLKVEATALADEKSETYNVLTLFDVLEHLGEPLAFFMDANRVLGKGGYVMAYAPNIHSFAYRLQGARQNTLYPFEHVGFYDEQSLNYLAKETGFQVESIEYYGLDVMDYLCMKSYDDDYDYLTKFAEVVPLLQAVIDKQNISNHMRVIFKKVFSM
mgnify:CR=1 FL=1